MALDIYYTTERHTKRWIAIFILLVLLATTGWYGYKWYKTGDIPFPLPIASADSGVDESTISDALIKKHTVPVSNPRYISIPSQYIDNTRIFSIDLDADKQLGTANNINDVSWYKKSSTPGSGGVVLINGHSTGIRRDGTFAKLKALQVDASIIIERGDGKRFTYKVVENKSMTIEEVASTGMKTMGQPVVPGKESLNIITNDGKWVPRLGTFDRRVLLRAAIEE